jgi:hypothetical protein
MKVIVENDTPFHAIGQVADLLEPPLAAVVVVKATFDLADDGTLRPSEHAMPLVPDILQTPFGEIHGELYFKKRGLDLCVLGTVRRSEPVTTARVRLSVGSAFCHELVVSGDRYWLPSAWRSGLKPSSPRTFTEMPLGYGRAFGGAAEFNGLGAPYPDNPLGLGYYLKAEQAEGSRLPNIEDATEPPLLRWDERPKVAGWGPYPSYWGLRATANVEVDPENYVVTRVDPGIFNHAHPDLVLDPLPPGTPIRIEGLHEAPISLRVPRAPAEVTVTIGERTHQVTAPIDGIFIWADAAKVVITQRARFSYEFRAGEIRRAAVTMRRG